MLIGWFNHMVDWFLVIYTWLRYEGLIQMVDGWFWRGMMGSRGWCLSWGLIVSGLRWELEGVSNRGFADVDGFKEEIWII